jgi:hypothetical protein
MVNFEAISSSKRYSSAFLFFNACLFFYSAETGISKTTCTEQPESDVKVMLI